MLNFRKKRALAVSLAALMLLLTLMGGCSSSGNQAGTGENISFLKQNNIEIKTVEMDNFNENAPQTYLYTKVEISGLKDSSIQDSINQAISDKYSEIMETELPPYRGISSKVDTSVRKDSETVSMNVTGNYNNILSVLIICNVSRGGMHYIDCHTMNFDLNTGEQISLRELFPEDENCDTLNQAAADKLDAFGNRYGGGNVYDTSKEYLMLSVFKGIDENQKFYLSDKGIHLVFDYTNPEFYFPAFAPYEVEIGFDEVYEALNLGVFDRSGESLYTDEEDKYILVYGNEKMAESDKEVPDGGANVHYGMNCTYPEGLPENVKEKAGELNVFDDEFAASLKKEAASAPAYQYGYTNDVRVNHIGNYYNLIHSVSYYKANYWGEDTESFVYDVNGNELEISDLFREGADYEKVIKNFIEEKLSYDFPDGNYGGYTLEEVYEGISFSLDNYGLQIRTQPIKFTMEYGETDYESSVSIFIPYEEFGCDQMTIFN